MEKDVEITLGNLLDANQAQYQRPEESMRSRLTSAGRNAPLDHGIRRLGYVLGKELGRGALGRVNLATQQVFDRAVAVKRLLQDSNDHESSMKFYAEAVITSQLEHPNIVPIHDLLANADGSLQLVMKRVEGISWRDLLRPKIPEHKLRSEQLSLDDHVDILLKVCDAVAFAHGRGILHRDIKPENVMVGGFGEVLLMDWGCAVAYGEFEHHPIVPRVEEITEVTGTPSYMAPEMALIRTASIGPCSDVYQLGAVLYELLTGMHPNRGKTVLEVLTSSVQGPLSDPHLIAPERFIPEELAAIAMAALVKDPKKRLSEVSQFVDRLRNYRRHVQAIVLVGTARGQLSLASSNSKMADEALRKATSWAEQALEIWPNWSGAKSVLLDARLASAQHSFAHGSFTLSAQQAMAAAQLAKELQRVELEENALSLTSKAKVAMDNRATRLQRIRLMRIGVGCLLALTVIGLGFYLEILDHREKKLTMDLQQAKSALSILQRNADLEQSSPNVTADSFVANQDQISQAITNRQWNLAITGLDQIVAKDPNPVQTRMLRTGVAIIQKRYSIAAEACEQWLVISPADPQALRLRTILHNFSDGAELDPETSDIVGKIFTDLKCQSIASHFLISVDRRLAIYRERLNSTWPGLGDCLRADENGRISASGKRWTSALAQQRNLTDLTPLRGIPLVDLDLSNTAITTLAPLMGLALESLSINNTAINEISALAGMPLYELDMADTLVSDLTPLSGGKLRILNAHHSRITDLQPLHDISFLLLDCSDTKVSSLAFLLNTRQRNLIFDNCPISDLSPLLSCVVENLSLIGCPEQDALTVAQLRVSSFSGQTNANAVSLRSIARMRGNQLNLGTASNLSDLAPIAQMPLISLIFHGTRVSYLSALQSMPLESLVCDHSPISDLSPLRNLRLIRLDISSCPVSGLTVLAHMPLESLLASNTPISNQMLNALEHVKISQLWIDHTKVTDLSLLAKMPLTDLRVGPFADWHKVNVDLLRRNSNLRFIGISPKQFLEANEFWAELDAGTLPQSFRQ